jgi:D-proline reductase (dithiol) PrdB
LIIPASELCHQTCAILARAIEQSGIPTMMIAVRREIVDRVRPPRAAFYDGDFGCVSGKPGWKQFQLRVLDESLRWIETFDQPTVKKLVVDLETQVETARGER